MTTTAQEGGGATSGPHDRYEDSVGAYALGALPDLEWHAFERHVMGCSACRDEVERLRPAVEALPRSVTPLEAPSALKASLMRAVAEDVPAPEAAAGPREGFLARARRRVEPVFQRARPVAA